MDCSWADSYNTDNDTFNIIKTPCYKNGPTTMQLLPYKSEDEYLRVKTKKNIKDGRNSKFRIGYNFVSFDSTRDVVYNVSTLTDKQHIFWSDTMQLAQFWKR